MIMTSWRERTEKINEEFREVGVTWLGTTRDILDVLTEENAEELIGTLEPAVREAFLEWVRPLFFANDEDVIAYDAPDRKPTSEDKEKLCILRAWVRKHPLPERTQAFPANLVNRLLVRVDAEHIRLLEQTKADRHHPEWKRSRRLSSVVVDLTNAIEIANAYPGPQPLALSWELLERALRNVDGLIDLNEDERQLANESSAGR
ncbi:MAG: hypothetical protein R3B70_12600 [Polyangiaceae bacterium]